MLLGDDGALQPVQPADLLGAMHRYQSEEFKIRAQVQPPWAIIQAATTVAAQLLQLGEQVGTVAPGAYADLLVVDGNPQDDITLLAAPERSLKVIMKGGALFREELDG